MYLSAVNKSDNEHKKNHLYITNLMNVEKSGNIE